MNNETPAPGTIDEATGLIWGEDRWMTESAWAIWFDENEGAENSPREWMSKKSAVTLRTYFF